MRLVKPSSPGTARAADAAEPARPERARGARLGRWRATDLLALCAVGAIVVLVSLPRLRDWALRENEIDALRFARHLASLLEEQHGSAANVGELLAADPEWESSQRDAAVLRGGQLLRRRGYLFDLASSSDGAVVRAWPWEQGQTGLGAFVVLQGGASFGHANADQSCSGPERPPPLGQALAGAPIEAAWHRLSARPAQGL